MIKMIDAEELVIRLNELFDKGLINSIDDVEDVVNEMAEEREDELTRYKFFAEAISALPNCNDCANLGCNYKPKWGEWVRFNCHMWGGEDKESGKEINA